MLASGRCQQSWCTTVYYKAELGTQQHCRDNVTMFSGQKNCCLLHYVHVRFGYPIYTPGPYHLSYLFVVTKALLRCRDVIVAKQKKCRVSSSGSIT